MYYSSNPLSFSLTLCTLSLLPYMISGHTCVIRSGGVRIIITLSPLLSIVMSVFLFFFFGGRFLKNIIHTYIYIYYNVWLLFSRKKKGKAHGGLPDAVRAVDAMPNCECGHLSRWSRGVLDLINCACVRAMEDTLLILRSQFRTCRLSSKIPQAFVSSQRPEHILSFSSIS
jgi:hypothetical protein